MAGLINDTAAAPAAPAAAGAPAAGSSTLGNALCQQMENGIEAKLTPENRNDYNKVVVAGLHIALARGPQSFMAKLHASQDPIGDCAKGAVALMLIMRKETKGAMPLEAGIPAGFTLMLHGLDFIDHAGIVKIGEPELVRATTLFTNNLFFRLGISPAMLQHATTRVHQIVQDPDAMAKINLKAGLTRHPDAATPTPVPGLTTPATGDTAPAPPKAA